MLKNFIKEAFSIVVGKQGENVVDIIDTKKYINEFIIAKKLDVTINQARNILYKISDFGLVSSIRKKDKRKGWFTYFWKIETLRTLEFLKNEINKKILNLEHQIKSRETKRFYVCERGHVEFAEENAILHDFVCPECGSILVLKDNTKLINEMKKSLDSLRKKLINVDEEIKNESEQIGKKIEKELKKEKKLKKEKLRKTREKRKKLRLKPIRKKKKKTKAKKKHKKKKIKKHIKKKHKKR